MIKGGFLMTNFQVYKKTLSFSFVEFLVGLLSLAIVAGAGTIGFFVANQSSSRALIGLVIGIVVGILIAAFISVFVTNRIKAAQISMMVKGVTENQLPEDSFKAGFREIKGRFGKITAFYFITNMIKGIFRQIGRGVERIGNAVGGDVGNSVASAINSAIQVLISYLVDCCLGWILYRKEINSAKAGCEGAVIFFKHGKTLARNAGRIFGMGLLSFVLVAGGLTGLFYLIFLQMPQMFQSLANEIVEFGTREAIDIPDFLKEVPYLTLLVAVVVGIILWSMLHSVLGRPFILVGVLRNFMEAGLKDIPTESDFKELESKSPRFAKLYNSK